MRTLPLSMARAGRAASRALRRLWRDESAVAMLELALSMPTILFLGLAGVEVSNMVTTHMKVSQIALSVADNASRLGQTDNSGVTPTVTEANLDEVIDGAMRAGESIDLQAHGRIIVTSLEYDDYAGRQFIHWQRCRGSLAVSSAYGNDGANNGLTGAVITGLGRGASKVRATSGQGIMFVEVYYDYDAIWDYLLGRTQRFVQEGGLPVRDDRNYGPGLTGGGSRSSCT